MSQNINELSRKGLVDLINDYDKLMIEEVQVKTFLNEQTDKGVTYEPVKAVEFVDPKTISIGDIMDEFKTVNSNFETKDPDIIAYFRGTGDIKDSIRD
jgi:hypothetical protein